jgi:L-rhamnose isomerase/sugar isomerase
VNFARAFERYLDAVKAIYAELPDDWRLFTEHKMYEPAFYSTVVQDWGTNYIIARETGERAFCLVDLGHHAPNVNIEMIVSRLIQFGKLGGFHFNDSKYGDDDLDAGSIDPYRLFLVFNELVDAELSGAKDFHPAHMLDQSHNVTDPIESLMLSAIEVQRAYAQALLVDRKALQTYQEGNDALMATQTLKAAYRTDVEPILAMARRNAGGRDRSGRGLSQERLPPEGSSRAASDFGGYWGNRIGPPALQFRAHRPEFREQHDLQHLAQVGDARRVPPVPRFRPMMRSTVVTWLKRQRRK